MIFSCHDVQFVESLANRVIELSGANTYDLRVTYAEYLADADRLARVGRAAAWAGGPVAPTHTPKQCCAELRRADQVVPRVDLQGACE